jgi:succinate-semialdehyde dehydrogenase/glutarate-semialdehyde dehydrogenase
MLVMREETFGPAAGVARFESIDEAIFLANDTVYGLAAIVYSSNVHTIKRCALEIEAGNVAVNNVDAGVINAPYGGWKASGFGREHGPEGLFEYLQTKHLRIRA